MKILIVEDDAVVAIMQKMWIAKTYNYKPEIFSNGLEAVNYLEQNPKENYLILLDLNMPVMNGWEFLEVVEQKDYSSQVSVIIITSSKFKEDYERAKESFLVIDFQHKPIGSNCLQKFIKNGELNLGTKRIQ